MRFRFIILVLLALLMTAGFAGAVSATDINNINIKLDEPNAGDTPNVKENLTGAPTGVNISSIRWDPGDTKFIPGKEYTVTIILDVASDYNFTTGTTVNLNSYPCKNDELDRSNSNKTLKITHTYDALDLEYVSSPITLSVEVPIEGNVPKNPTISTEGVTIESVKWNDNVALTKFSPNTTYVATITLKPSEGYTFPIPINVKVNNNDAEKVDRPSGNTQTLIVTQKFPITNYINIERLNLSLTALVAGQSPSIPTTTTDGVDQPTVVWSPSATTFEVNKPYTASITVKTKDGYKLDRTSVYLNGNSTTNINKKSDTEWIVNNTFANTSSSIDIKDVAISGITAPVTGATPVSASSSSTTGTTVKSITWNPTASTFASETIYTATVIVETNTPYKFSSTVNVGDISSVSATNVTRNSDTNISFKYTFGKTNSIIYPVITFTADQKTGAIPLDVIFTYNITNSTSQSITYGENSSTISLSDTNGTLKYKYTTAGTYTAKITATNANGTVYKEIKITPKAGVLNAYFTYTPQSRTVPLTVSFKDGSEGTITSRSWNFGGYGTSTETNPSFTFTNAGAHKVILTITDSSGAKDTHQEIIVVQAQTSSITKTTDETKVTTNTTSIIPNPIGIIQEFVKLFLSLFNFDNYIIFGNNATAPAV